MLCVSIVTFAVLLFSANQTFSQCGADGKQPCNNTTKKTVTPKKTKTVTKPTTPTKKTPTTISKPQTKFVPTAPNIEMVKISGGSFMMGGDERVIGEGPVHRVTISKDFYLGKYEVTQAQWQAVMGNNPSTFKNCSDCPVDAVSWDKAQQFIRTLNALQPEYEYRLPTEAEWEYACRAGTTTEYYFGNTISTIEANFQGDKYLEKTVPVGSYKPNAWGLYDMHGNTDEWVGDWFDWDYYANSPSVDPKGPSSGYSSWRVYRGGGYSTPESMLGCGFRNHTRADIENSGYGFRLVRE